MFHPSSQSYQNQNPVQNSTFRGNWRPPVSQAKGYMSYPPQAHFVSASQGCVTDSVQGIPSGFNQYSPVMSEVFRYPEHSSGPVAFLSPNASVGFDKNALVGSAMGSFS